MKKSGECLLFVIFLFGLLFFIPFVYAETSVDQEIKKLTHYAEEYETGNINYVELLLYSSAVRENLNKILGAKNRDFGGTINKDEIEKGFGKPDEETKWVWVEREEREMKLDEPVPVWRRVIFDGNNIQIKLEVNPTIFKKDVLAKEFDKEIPEDIKGNLKEEYELKNNEKKDQIEKIFNFYEKGMALIYRINFQTFFKNPEEELNLEGDIAEIKSLAESFNSDPTRENADALAKKSIGVEKKFQSYFAQGGKNCEDVMNSILGSENKRDTQKIYVQESELFTGENFEAKLRLEMCDECQWNWINLNLNFEGRGPGFKGFENKGEFADKQAYDGYDNGMFKSEIKGIIENVKRYLSEGNNNAAFQENSKLWMINEAWNKKSNDIWKEVDEKYNQPLVNNNENQGPYFWIEREIEKRNYEKQLRKSNYEERKNFYQDLFSGYEKTETYYEQVEWEKRLIEEFKEFGEEICDNGVDDNKNEQIDCSDSQCGGKICGQKEIEIVVEEGNTIEGSVSSENSVLVEETPQINQENNVVNNEVNSASDVSGTITGNVVENSVSGETTSEETSSEGSVESSVLQDSGNAIKKTVNLYCIQGACQQKEEIVRDKVAVCGNHFCDSGENIENCAGDCSKCKKYEGVECDGKVIFKGKDKDDCPLDPICIKEDYCEKDDDCSFLCGTGQCVENKCVAGELVECQDAQCIAGDKKIEKCSNGDEIVIALCTDAGIWSNLDLKCPEILEVGGEETEEGKVVGEKGVEGVIVEGGVVGNDCVVKENCGGINDVCSNGKCVTIPESVETGGSQNIEVVVGETENIERDEIVDSGENNIEENKQTETEGENRIDELKEESPENDQSSSESSSSSAEVTGNFVFNLFRGIVRFIINPSLTGNVIIGYDVIEGGDASGSSSGAESSSESSSSSDMGSGSESSPEIRESAPGSEPGGKPQYSEGTGERIVMQEGENGMQPGQPPEQFNNPEQQPRKWTEEDRAREEQNRQEMENRDRGREQEDKKSRCSDDCKRNCHDRKVGPCVQNCVFNFDKKNKEELGDLEECKKKCEEEISGEVEACAGDCVSYCLKDDWEEFDKKMNSENQKNNPKEEKGVFKAGGSCRKSNGKTESFIYFDGWGDPFEKLQSIKQKYYNQGEPDFCKIELENLIKQRQEFEKSFNEEFARWFFEDYLANSAEDWEQHISGIFELYWKNVDNQREIAFRMNCLKINDINKVYNPKLINFKYETKQGSIEYWEEMKSVNIPGIDGEVIIVSPYMKTWVFPPESFIKYEMKKAMKEHEFPGSSKDSLERKNEEGPTEKEKEFIKQDKNFMNSIKKISEKYGGSLEGVVQIKDFETNEVVFNLYVVINEEDIVKIEPMLPEEVPNQEIKIEIDYNKVYELIEMSEKEMSGTKLESPPWDKKSGIVQGVKEFVSGVKMYFKVKGLISSANVTPADAESDVKKITKLFMNAMMSGGDNGGESPSGDMGKVEKDGTNNQVDQANSDDIFNSRDVMTGEVVRK